MEESTSIILAKTIEEEHDDIIMDIGDVHIEEDDTMVIGWATIIIDTSEDPFAKILTPLQKKREKKLEIWK